MSGRPKGRATAPQFSFLLVIAVVVLGFVRVFMGHWREGSVLLGGALLLAAGLRVLLADEQAGLLKIRGRGVDVLLYGLLGGMVVLVALTIEGGPLG
ncbi:DUF3017 domain-containing protein [Actinoalloteichus sp. AHMU CJ021]|uniref:DUF3017 family protein n=1 Tax=Actinoalloteichus caeruleus DSM 43889 TaxID=1120930 RepID=A0ABT1JLZ4_ACTCY|nr:MULTISPECIES: DUF3017 domain-containing protein [Actinoalloteichus]AUS79274.1 DUF3017 domain-containing protein [Actinoalloteichus sp. AHMU CJ021]MCP2333545.1 Protein of unknown function (DUF3017) [Actinoalloteichus caeruleus DSM 43889]